MLHRSDSGIKSIQLKNLAKNVVVKIETINFDKNSKLASDYFLRSFSSSSDSSPSGCSSG